MGLRGICFASGDLAFTAASCFGIAGFGPLANRIVIVFCDLAFTAFLNCTCGFAH